jgi:glutathione peroxidase-family protein
VIGYAHATEHPQPAGRRWLTAVPRPGVHEFSIAFPDGSSRSLSDYAGTPLLLVNVASRCGFTPQYEGLERLARAGTVQVIGFPCNQFGGQEPGTTRRSPSSARRRTT